MRKISRRRKKVGMVGLLTLFLCCLTCIGIGYSLLSQDLIVQGKATLVKQDANEEKLRFTYTKDTWGSNPYTVQFNITIENISDEIFENWEFSIPIEEELEIVNAWNTIAEIKDGMLVLKNKQYNGNLGIGSKITLGIQLRSNTKDIELENPNVNPEDEQKPEQPSVNNSDIEVVFTSSQSWTARDGIYTSYRVTVKNNGKEDINSWSFKMKLPDNARYSSSWGANYIVQETGVVFSNVSYNGSIKHGKSVSFGVIICSSEPNFIPTYDEIKVE